MAATFTNMDFVNGSTPSWLQSDYKYLVETTGSTIINLPDDWHELVIGVQQSAWFTFTINRKQIEAHANLGIFQSGFATSSSSNCRVYGTVTLTTYQLQGFVLNGSTVTSSAKSYIFYR